MKTMNHVIMFIMLLGVVFIGSVTYADEYDDNIQYQDAGPSGSFPCPWTGGCSQSTYTICDHAQGFECTTQNGEAGMLACQTCRIYAHRWYGSVYIDTERYCEECHK